MNRFFLRENASRARLKEASAACDHRREIVRALSWGRVSRRDLLKCGLFTAAGLLAPIRGLSPFVGSAYAAGDDSIPTGLAPSPLFGVKAFTQPMLRFDLLPRRPLATLSPAPTEESNQTSQPIDPLLGGGVGPIEGRPPGPLWAHQGYRRFPPSVAIELTQEGAKVNVAYDPGCDATTIPECPAGRSAVPVFIPNFQTRTSRRSGPSTVRYRPS
jgi:hypothetical protein